jgi:hypothetical protein
MPFQGFSLYFLKFIRLCEILKNSCLFAKKKYGEEL